MVIFIVAYPQMKKNKMHLGLCTPKVPTENYDLGELKKWQIAQGLTMDRYETYIGSDKIQSPGIRFEDKFGLEIISREHIASNNVSIRQLFKLIIKHPFSIIGIYTSHFVNYLIIVWNHCNITDINVSMIGVLCFSMFLWQLFFLVCF